MSKLRAFMVMVGAALTLGLHFQASAQQIIRYENTNFPSYDLRNMGAGSFDECAQMCLGDSNCKAFTFARDQNRCYLKSGAGQASPTMSAVSGIVADGNSAGNGYAPQGTAPACRVGDTDKCPGCSVSCQPGQKAVCTPGNPSLGNSCLVNAQCECHGKPTALIPPMAPQAPVYAPPARGPSCNIASSQKCTGCSVSCSAGQKAICSPSNPSLGGGCFIEAKCECQGG